MLPILTYETETWRLTKGTTRKIKKPKWLAKKMSNRVTDHKTIMWIKQHTKVIDAVEQIASLKWKWAGHLAIQDDDRWTKWILQWWPIDSRRSWGKSLTRLRDNIVKWTGISCIRATQDRSRWKYLSSNIGLSWYRETKRLHSIASYSHLV